ncbi:MAG: hypothetical protein JKY56_15635 [Kofleriaceae bacterium]|nr:hypothetical protein [Kofleriaceae bacterium]
MLIKIVSILVAYVSVFVLPANDAAACGPDFPIALLSQRPTTMSQLPEGIFMKEVEHLVSPPAKRYLVSEGVEPVGARDGGSEVERALYDQGANSFNTGDVPAAIQAFEALLKLPSEQRQYRSTWAAFMLGRLQHGTASLASYQLVRTLVAAGFRDDLGLAAASLRQEAARYAVSGNRRLELARYAELASHGSHRAGLALLFLVRDEFKSGAVTSLATDPIGQKLLGAYLYSRRNEISDRQMTMALNALAQPKTLKGGARLAAAAYREGKWGMAQRFANQDAGDGLAKWVLAKLASRQGNHRRAKTLMALVEKLLTPEVCSSNTRSRISAERTVLALQSGDISNAMKYSQHSIEHSDTALYVAEKVLTIGELTSFIKYYSDRDDQDIRESLSDLLARRLMREGHRALEAGKRAQAERHFNSAQTYFNEKDYRSAKVLAASLLIAFSETNSIERAKAFYQASTMARSQGLELLGTSLAPDWQEYGAQFDLSEHVFTQPPGKWLGKKEARRVKASAPMFSKRYHYRYLASHLAEKAADSLPRTSQAFAAVLCHATRYIYQVDGKRVRDIWTRYVRQGPTVDFASQFGIKCPEPDFTAAQRTLSQKSKPIDLITPLRSFGAWSLSKLSAPPPR